MIKELSINELEVVEGGVDWGKCIAGTAGSGILGFFAGAGGGSVVPVVGTATGAVLGTVGGVLTGAATFCD